MQNSACGPGKLQMCIHLIACTGVSLFLEDYMQLMGFAVYSEDCRAKSKSSEHCLWTWNDRLDKIHQYN